MKFTIYGTWHNQNEQLTLKISQPLGGDDYNIELYRSNELLFREKLGLYFSRGKHIHMTMSRLSEFFRTRDMWKVENDKMSIGNLIFIKNLNNNDNTI